MTRGWKMAVFAFVCVLMLGCQPRNVTDATVNGGGNAAPDGGDTVTGRLVAVKDGRPVDGGVDLTVETESGKQEILRVGSAFIAGPRDSVLALHRVVDAAKIGNRLRASGRRDESGALMVERLEILE